MVRHSYKKSISGKFSVRAMAARERAVVNHLANEPVKYVDANVVYCGVHNIWQVSGKVDALVTLFSLQFIRRFSKFKTRGVTIVDLSPDFRKVAFPGKSYGDLVVRAGTKVSELVRAGKKVAICCYAGKETSKAIALFYKSLNRK